VRHPVYFLIISFLALAGCASSSIEKNTIPDSIGGDSGTLILNYENRLQKYKRSNIDSHLKIYIEIEKPYIITNPSLKEMDRIYSIAALEGTSVFRAEINERGEIISLKKILSAGLALDEAAEDILKQIKLEPSYLAGDPRTSFADIKISFRADGAE
jgi:hypothetical protein